METTSNPVIKIDTTVNAPAERVWELWTKPEHITGWNFANDEWHSPSAENDLRPGGKFSSRMEAKDGSFGFDFGGTYQEVVPHSLITYTLEDDRKVKITFEEQNGNTRVVEEFEAEGTNPVEMQRDGWQAILNNFKKYVESR